MTYEHRGREGRVLGLQTIVSNGFTIRTIIPVLADQNVLEVTWHDLSVFLVSPNQVF